MKITIDDDSGFCWGVVRTVDKAEEVLLAPENDNVYVLGAIIHNPREIERLESKGLKTINHKDLQQIAGQSPKVIIRAHGEPPETYKLAEDLGINIIDATCPLVQTLQERIKKAYNAQFQIVILGKKDHAEVIGLRGVCNDECIVIKSEADANKIDYTKKTMLFSQTTIDKPSFQRVKIKIEEKFIELYGVDEAKKMFIAKDTICVYVSRREDSLHKFATDNDLILFVAGKNSSNGRSLFNVCHGFNHNTYFIEDVKDINMSWFEGIGSIGITGATSTPQWYMTLVKNELEKIFK